jgi:selenocysteine lyase/cysteine desulfurase
MQRVAFGDRSLFPDLEARVYLNHAAVSPPSVRVQAAANRVLQDYGRLGLGGVFPWMDQRARLKQQLGALLGVSADQLALGSSTNRCLVDLALCMDWQPGDRVVLFQGEFPANTTPWQAAAAHFGVDVVWETLDGVPEGHMLERLEATLRDGARLVAVSAVQFSTGLAMPLADMAALCHRYGAELAVDVIQAAGVVPLDLGALGVDYAAGGGHKWLMGLEGVGYLYARSTEHLVPRVAGWLSHEDPVAFLMLGAGHLTYDRPIRCSVDWLEIGSTNAVGCAALEAGIAPIAELGVAQVFAHVQALHDALEAPLEQVGLKSLRAPQGYRSGTLSFAGSQAMEMGQRLGASGVAVTTPDGILRLAPHWPNGLDQVPLILQAAGV